MLSAEEIKAILIIPALAGGSIFAGFRMLSSARRIRDTPTSRIQSAAQGQIEFQGYAWPADAVIKRPNGQPCVHYWWSVERYEKRGKNSRWVSIFSETSQALPFLIVDETAAAFVESQKCDVKTICEIRKWNQLNDSEKKFFSDFVGSKINGFPPLTGLFGLFMQTYRICENHIPIGSPLFAFGHFETPADYPLEVESPGLNHFISRILRLKGSHATRLSLLDSDRDGKISHSEMTRGYHLAALSSLSKSENVQLKNPFRIQGKLTSTPDVSAKIHIGDQDQALRSLRLAWLWLAIGAAVASFYVYYLIRLLR